MKALIPSTTKLFILQILVNSFFFVICQNQNDERTEACDILIAYGKNNNFVIRTKDKFIII